MSKQKEPDEVVEVNEGNKKETNDEGKEIVEEKDEILMDVQQMEDGLDGELLSATKDEDKTAADVMVEKHG